MTFTLAIVRELAAQTSGFPEDFIDKVAAYRLRVRYRADIAKTLLKNDTCCPDGGVPEFRICRACTKDWETA
jgi:hypothetical protein